jgi:hypothetical protein
MRRIKIPPIENRYPFLLPYKLYQALCHDIDVQNFPLRPKPDCTSSKIKIIRFTYFFLRLEKFSRALIETTNTLNWFDDYAGNISFL